LKKDVAESSKRRNVFSPRPLGRFETLIAAHPQGYNYLSKSSLQVFPAQISIFQLGYSLL